MFQKWHLWGSKGLCLHIPTEGEISWPCTIFSIQRKYYLYILTQLKIMYRNTCQRLREDCDHLSDPVLLNYGLDRGGISSRMGVNCISYNQHWESRVRCPIAATSPLFLFLSHKYGLAHPQTLFIEELKQEWKGMLLVGESNRRMVVLWREINPGWCQLLANPWPEHHLLLPNSLPL